MVEKVDQDHVKNMATIKGTRYKNIILFSKLYIKLNFVTFVRLLLFDVSKFCRAGDTIHKQSKKAGLVYKIIGDEICCSNSRCSVSFQLDSRMSHATMYLAYQYEKNKDKRCGYLYKRNRADRSFSVIFMTTEPFSVIKNDKRFLGSMQDLYPKDKFKSFC